MENFIDKEIEDLKNLLSMDAENVLHEMARFLRERYGQDNVIENAKYIIAKGEIPICLLAHADTVFTKPPTLIVHDAKQEIMWSPHGLGADDRAGVFAIRQIIREGFKPHVVITDGEEIGCEGASIMIHDHPTLPFEQCNMLIQLDRRGVDDSVYYNCENEEFEKFINSFDFKTALGSFTDISVVGPAWKIAAVNLSVGYINEHSSSEMLFLKVLRDTIEKVECILDIPVAQIPFFKYIGSEKTFSLFNPAGAFNPIGSGYNTQSYNYTYPCDFNYNDDEYCDHCGKYFPVTDLIPVVMDENKDTEQLLCPDCFESICDNVCFCEQCRDLIYIKPLPQNADNYICKRCRKHKNKILDKSGIH